MTAGVCWASFVPALLCWCSASLVLTRRFLRFRLLRNASWFPRSCRCSYRFRLTRLLEVLVAHSVGLPVLTVLFAVCAD